MRILLTAEPFGFGPAGKAITIAKSIRNLDTHHTIFFAGRDNAYQFAQKNDQLFEEVLSTETESIGTLVESLAPDLGMSIVGASPVLEMLQAASTFPVIYVDSLFWYWHSDDASMKSTLERIGPEPPAADDGSDYDTHKRKLVAHALADKSYVQRYPVERDGNVPRDAFEPIEVVDPIVDTSHATASTDRLIVSLCGQLSPVVSLSQAVTYAETVLDGISPALRSASEQGYQPLVVGNERVLSRIDIPYELTFLDHDAYLEELGRSAGLVCPPSITSVYEAVAYDVPVVLLPEQHSGHWYNYQGMNQKDLGTPFEGAILGERFPRLRELDEQDADELYKILAAAPESASNGPAIFKHVRRLIKDLCNPEQRTQRAFRQREALLHDGRTLNGSEYIANDLVYNEAPLSEQ